MTPEKNPKATPSEIGLLVAIALVAAIAFSPVGSSFSIAGIDLMAWLLFAVMILGPAAALIIALRTQED